MAVRYYAHVVSRHRKKFGYQFISLFFFFLSIYLRNHFFLLPTLSNNYFYLFWSATAFNIAFIFFLKVRKRPMQSALILTFTGPRHSSRWCQSLRC